MVTVHGYPSGWPTTRPTAESVRWFEFAVPAMILPYCLEGLISVNTEVFKYIDSP